MTQQVAAERFLLDQAAVGIIDVLDLIVRRFPAGEFIGRYMQPDGRMSQHLTHAHLDVPRQVILVIVEFLHLTTQILGNQRGRELMIGIIEVDTQVGGNGSRSVVLIFGVQVLQRYTAAELLADVVAVGQAEGHIAGVEGSRSGAVNVSALDVAVTKVLQAHGNGTMLAHALAVAQSGEIGLADVAHVVQSHLMVIFRAQQCGVLLNEVDVIVDNGQVVAAQAIDMARSGHTQEVIGRGLGAVISHGDKGHCCGSKQYQVTQIGCHIVVFQSLLQ